MPVLPLMGTTAANSSKTMHIMQAQGIIQSRFSILVFRIYGNTYKKYLPISAYCTDFMSMAICTLQAARDVSHQLEVEG